MIECIEEYRAKEHNKIVNTELCASSQKKTERRAFMQAIEQFAPGVILHGGDYNPDQWLDRPDTLEDDIRFMKEAHINEATLGVFAWSMEEPEEGRYDLDWLEKTVDRLYENGIRTILATPTGAMPHWLTEKYPEVMKVDEHGIRRMHGQRHNFCPSSPVLRRKMQGINEALARRLGKHPGVIAWHLSNEYGGDSDAQTFIGCHCPYCEAAFRTYLKERYGTLEKLNRAWWAGFWSNRFTSWEQIHCPGEGSEHTMHGIKLDYRRFVSARMLDFARAERDAVRKYSDRPVCTNMMGTFDPLDYFKWAGELDFVSVDCYPQWHIQEDDTKMAQWASLYYALTRSLKRMPFLLMESVVSSVNWTPRNIIKRPGMHMLSSLQAIANGADSVQYFQWRASRGSSEKFHGAVISQLNGNNTRVFREVKALGERLEKLAPRVLGTVNRPQAAILYDWENIWAVNDAQALVNPFDFNKRFLTYYGAFWDRGIDTDLIDMDSDLTPYRLVFAPFNYMYRKGWVEKVRRFVENGGVFVTTCWSGIVDENDLCFLQVHPLADLLGIRPEEYDVSAPYMQNTIDWGEDHFLVKDVCGVIHAEGAEVLAVYGKNYYAGSPALTIHGYGKGKALYAAAEGREDFIGKLLDEALREAGVKCPIEMEPVHGVTVSCRQGDGRKLSFVQNFNNRMVEVFFRKPYQNAESGERVEGAICLEAYQCLILEETQRKTESLG